MILLSKSIKMAPIVIGLAASSLVYSDTEIVVDSSSKTIDHLFNTTEYRSQIKRLNRDGFYLRSTIKMLTENWQRETMILSDIHKIIEHRSFQQILQYGRFAVPAILEEIKERPSTLVWALNLIIGKKISSNNLTINEACRAWVNWGVVNKHLLNA